MLYVFFLIRDILVKFFLEFRFPIHRSSRSGRKLTKIDSSTNVTQRQDSSDRQVHPVDGDALTRDNSFSNYGILPPIKHDESKTDMDKPVDGHYQEVSADQALHKQIPHLHGKLSNGENSKLFSDDKGKSRIGERSPQYRTLYRKGDIFANSEKESGETGLQMLADKFQSTNFTDNSSAHEIIFSVPTEPDSNASERIRLAFRIRNRSRLERYFLPNDRVGDVIAFLQDALFDDAHERKLPLELYVNDFPRRKLDCLDSTLSDSKVGDKTLLDVMICADPDVP